MTTIWKFPLELTDEQKIKVPQSFVPLSVDWQHGRITLWAAVVPDTLTEATVHIVGTGNPIPEGVAVGDFVGTVKMASDQLVWHVFVARWFVAR